MEDYRIIPNNDVYENDGCYDSTFDPVSKGERQNHDDREDKGQTVRDLPEKDLKDRDLLTIFEAIGAVRSKARGRFIAS
jgi:hypothetical protein